MRIKRTVHITAGHSGTAAMFIEGKERLQEMPLRIYIFYQY